MRIPLTVVLAFAAWPVTAQEAGNSQADKTDFKPSKGVVKRSLTETDHVLDAARERMNRQDDAWFHNGDYLPVIANQELLVELDSADEESWSSLIWMYQNVENAEMTWITARRFAAANPTYVDARYYEAQFLFFKRMYAKIPPLLEPAIARTPGPDHNAFRFLAHSYTRMGYLSDALRVWDMYIKINPSDGTAKVNRNKVAAALNKQ